MGLLTARHDVADTTKSDRLGYDLSLRVRKFTNRKAEVVTLAYATRRGG
jgi:hypothetical protein